MSLEEFKEARRALGLTQSELAAILDTAPRTIRKWETAGERSTARSVKPGRGPSHALVSRRLQASRLA